MKNIVTSGLVSWWDAGIRESYAGDSSTWHDLLGAVDACVSQTLLRENNYFDFAGSDGATLNESITLGNGKWTILAWATYKAVAGTFGAILSNDNGGPVANAMGLGSVGTAKIDYEHYNAEWIQHAGNTIISPNVWTQCAWVNNDSSMLMYVNNKVDCSEFNSYTANGSPVDSIGHNWYVPHNGNIGCVLYYNRSLSLAEIQQNYHAIGGRFKSIKPLRIGNTVMNMFHEALPVYNYVIENLLFYYDVNNPSSYLGSPTTNDVPTANMGVYNNPGFTVTNEELSETFKGYPIHKITYTPQDESYVPRLSSYEGFGSYTDYQFYDGSQYYMTSIYFKTSNNLYPDAQEGFSNGYANVGFWLDPTARYKEGDWYRLYTRFYNNVSNGYAQQIASINYFDYVINTNSSINTVVYQICSSSWTFWNATYFTGLIDGTYTPWVANNDGLTGLGIEDHGLNPTTFTKLSDSNARNIFDASFAYYYKLTPINTGGVNKTVNIGNYFLGLFTKVGDNKYWKITFSPSDCSVNVPVTTYWAAPMREVVTNTALWPSKYDISTRTKQESLYNVVNNSPLDLKNLIFDDTSMHNFIFGSIDTSIDGTYTTQASDGIIVTSFGDAYDSFSDECWLKCSDVSLRMGVIGYLMNSTAGYSSGGNANIIISGNKIQAAAIATGDGGYTILNSTNTISQDVWYHVIVTKDKISGTMKLYVNGSKNDEGVVDAATFGWWSGQPIFNSNTFGIGLFNSSSDSGPNRFFKGQISLVRHYTKALEADEVLKNYNASKVNYI